ADRKPGEKSQLYELGLHRILHFQLGQRLIKADQFVLALRFGQISDLQVNPLESSTMLFGLLVPGRFDQDPPHRLGGRHEEMSPAVPFGRIIRQPNIGFMHEGRRLKRLARTLLSQFRRRQFAQLVVDQREELIRGLGIALLNRRQDGRDFVHAARQRLELSGGFAPRYLIHDWQTMTQGADLKGVWYWRLIAGALNPTCIVPQCELTKPRYAPAA